MVCRHGRGAKACQERHILPSVEQSLAQLGGARVFSKLAANSGFWQVKLSEESALLINNIYYTLWEVLF